MNIKQRTIKLAVEDFYAALSMSPIWLAMGNYELKERHSRSVLGPFWLVLSTAVQVAVTSFVLSILFKMNLERFLPYIAISLILWQYFSNAVMETSLTFVSNGEIIKSIKRPYNYYIFLALWRNLLLSAYGLFIFLVCLVIFQIKPTINFLLVVPGLFLFILNVYWLSLFLAICTVRYRDVPPVIQNSLTILFWLTPVCYRFDQLPINAQYFIRFNPLTHWLEVVRAPFLMEQTQPISWFISIGTIIVGGFVTGLLFAYNRHKLSLWV